MTRAEEIARLRAELDQHKARLADLDRQLDALKADTVDAEAQR